MLALLLSVAVSRAGCYAGNYENLTTGSCINCPKGKYQDVSSQTQCKNCTVGKFQSSQARTYCRLCAYGTYSGDYQNEEGKTQCKICEIGGFQDDSGQSQCKLCEAGKYQDEVQEGCSYKSCGCKDCGVGAYQDEVGQTGCIQEPKTESSSDDTMLVLYIVLPLVAVAMIFGVYGHNKGWFTRQGGKEEAKAFNANSLLF